MRKEVFLLRKHIYDFLYEDIFTSGSKNILEFGPMRYYWTPVKEYFVDTKLEFSKNGSKYVSSDIDPLSFSDYTCDILESDKLIQEKFDCIIALDVLEHVTEIWRTPQVFYNLLNDNGKIFISVPYLFYYHGKGNFLDLWRVSKDGLYFLFDKLFYINKIDAIYEDGDEKKPIHFNMQGTKK